VAAGTDTAMPAEPFIMDGARETLAPLLALRPLVWKHAPAQGAKDFDTGLYLLSVLFDTVRWRSEVDSEAAMERMLPQVDERMGAGARALRGLAGGGPAAAFAQAIDAVTAPAREHLARMRSAQRVHPGPSAVLKLGPEEYLILCAVCEAPAERLRAWPNSIGFSRRTGAVPAADYPLGRAPALFAQLERDGADALCSGLDRERKIIGYCPDCRALYCPAHYETQEKWSGSWLEDLHGTCAKGHRREIA
jgi:hypothetical protein